MARTDGKAENQHYVPAMLLQNFAVPGRGKEPQVHVFDKQRGKGFCTAVKKVAAERAFYDLAHGQQASSLEPVLSDLEAKAAPVIGALLQARRLGVLSSESKSWLALFIAVQRLRVRNLRQVLKHLDELMAEKIARMGHDPAKIKGWAPRKNEAELKVAASDLLVQSMGTFHTELLAKRWVLIEPPAGHRFWISDNPVVLHHAGEAGNHGNFGFATPGIEIYAPVSPTLLVGVWCPTIEKQFREGLAVSERTIKRLDSLGVPPTIGACIEQADIRRRATNAQAELEPICSAMSVGTPFRVTPQNMRFYNSLQVVWAERYLMADCDDFSFAMEMLAEKPHLRDGPRMRLD